MEALLGLFMVFCSFGLERSVSSYRWASWHQCTEQPLRVDDDDLTGDQGSNIWWAIPLGGYACSSIISEVPQLHHRYAISSNIPKVGTKHIRVAYRNWLAGIGGIWWLSLWHPHPRPHRPKQSHLQSAGLAGYITVLGSNIYFGDIQHSDQQRVTTGRKLDIGYPCFRLLRHSDPGGLSRSARLGIRSVYLVSKCWQLANARALILCWPHRPRVLASGYVLNALANGRADMNV